MTKEELWNFYVLKNPSFESDEIITMKTTGLKKMFELTYEIGYKAGKERLNESKSDNYINDLFKGIFK